MEESKDKPKEEIEVKELSDVDKDKQKEKKEKKEKKEEVDKDKDSKSEEPQFKKIQVHEGKADITKKDPNIKTLNITASLKPEKKKEGHGIKLE